MNSTSDLSQSREYLSFRSCIPLRKIIVDSYSSKGWKIYDAGPKSVTSPLVCLPPVSGTADIYFKQLMSLSAKGYRIISAEHPPYWNVREWCEGFKKLMDQLGLIRVHLFGASLGGYLAQKFAEHTFHCQKVSSLILCNSFVNTSIFSYTDSAALFYMLPSMILKKMVMGNFPQKQMDKEIMDSIDFMVEKLESLSQQDLASRLTINCLTGYVDTHKINSIPVTVTDVFDEHALSSSVREEMYKSYPHAKLAHLKSGGNFPYLSRTDADHICIFCIGDGSLYGGKIYLGERSFHQDLSCNHRYFHITESPFYVDLMISDNWACSQIHLRPFVGTPFSALDSS